jgi:VWFA-related protein
MSLAVCTALCQSASEKDSTAPTIRATATLVIVPTLVRSKTGEFIRDLRPGDFALTDNGVEQRVFAEEVKNQGLAIAVLMQIGVAAPRDFQNYRTLTSMLDVTASTSTHKVALVTFDSRPQQIWNFPPRTDGLEYAFRHPVSGDRGAAIMDAVNRGIDLLQEQPATLRRVILILSQPQDVGSTTLPQEIVRRLGESNTTVYSVTFLPERTTVTKERPETCSANTNQGAKNLVSGNDPPATVLKRICQETASQLAILSGGEHVHIKDKGDLERCLSILSEDFSNSYMLSFRPSSGAAGFHAISVRVGARYSHFVVSARSAYWAGP